MSGKLLDAHFLYMCMKMNARKKCTHFSLGSAIVVDERYKLLVHILPYVIV